MNGIASVVLVVVSTAYGVATAALAADYYWAVLNVVFSILLWAAPPVAKYQLENGNVWQGVGVLALGLIAMLELAAAVWLSTEGAPIEQRVMVMLPLTLVPVVPWALSR